MQFSLSSLPVIVLFGILHCQIAPNNTYNVPLLDFTNHLVNKSRLCSTRTCCPIGLTSDDGPDAPGRATDAIISYLHANQIPSTFFMNTEGWVHVNTNLGAQKSIRDLVDYGFNLGTHTVHHKDLANLSSAEIREEIVGVQTTVNTFLSPPSRLSLFRAPYGSPYDLGPQIAMDTVSKTAADAGYFHVGWQLDSSDYACGNNITCVTEPILRAVDEGGWGIVLMHFVYQNTANALPSLIAGLRERKCEFFTVEQFVQAKYGKSSASVMDDFNGKSRAVLAMSSVTKITIFVLSTVLFYFWK